MKIVFERFDGVFGVVFKVGVVFKGFDGVLGVVGL